MTTKRGHKSSLCDRKLSCSSVGESACADSELLMAIPPRFLPKVIEGLAALHKNGLRYPAPPYGIQSDAGAGLSVSYPSPNRA